MNIACREQETFKEIFRELTQTSRLWYLRSTCLLHLLNNCYWVLIWVSWLYIPNTNISKFQFNPKKMLKSLLLKSAANPTLHYFISILLYHFTSNISVWLAFCYLLVVLLLLLMLFFIWKPKTNRFERKVYCSYAVLLCKIIVRIIIIVFFLIKGRGMEEPNMDIIEERNMGHAINHAQDMEISRFECYCNLFEIKHSYFLLLQNIYAVYHS